MFPDSRTFNPNRRTKMSSSIPESHKLRPLSASAYSEHLYAELVALIEPHVRSVLAEVFADETRQVVDATSGSMRADVERNIGQEMLDEAVPLLARRAVTAWHCSFLAADPTNCGPDLLPSAKKARAIYFSYLSNLGYSADQLLEILRRYSATLPEPQLPDAMVMILELSA